jgi:hypothetical protein
MKRRVPIYVVQTFMTPKMEKEFNNALLKAYPNMLTSTKSVIRTRKIVHNLGGTRKTSFYKYKVWLSDDDKIVAVCNEFGHSVMPGSDCWEYFQKNGI